MRCISPAGTKQKQSPKRAFLEHGEMIHPNLYRRSKEWDLT